MPFNFIETMINLLVPDKRTTNTVAFLSPPANQIQVNNNNLFTVYKEGGDFNDWTTGTTYSTYNIVKYGKQVYYSTIDNNLDIYPGNDGWELITNNFIGASDRVFFNGTKLVFEYAINTYFGTVYEPDTTLNSEIYVETLVAGIKTFRIGDTENISDKILFSNSTGYIKFNNPPNITEYNLTIWVKDMGQPGKPTEGEIKSFADRYIVAGIVYRIQSY